MANKYMLDACWGDWFFTTNTSNLNGQISVLGNHSDGTQERLTFVLQNNGDTISWKDTGARWDAILFKIAPGVWKFNKGSGPYLLIYEI